MLVAVYILNSALRSKGVKASIRAEECLPSQAQEDTLQDFYLFINSAA